MRLSPAIVAAPSNPRRVAVDRDGMLWVAYFGNGKLAKLDPT